MAYSAKYDQKNLDAVTSRQAGSYLFDTAEIPLNLKKSESDTTLKNISKSLDMRTIIKGSQTFALLSYLGVLRDGFNADAARICSDVIKSLSVSYEGIGRDQAVEVLNGSLPKEIEVKTGRA